MLIGKRIYELRTEKGLSQEDLAKAVGVNKSFMAHWEKTDRNRVDYAILIKLVRALGTTSDYLFGNSDRKN